MCRYYEVYFYIISALVAYGVVELLRKYKTKRTINYEPAFRIIILLCVIASAYAIYRMPITTDTVTIKAIDLPLLDSGEMGTIEFIG